eukprot:GGOE01006571.1.p3 GENE.GGOE01006571.1~~GGOE01006571.1.p3  ORF type:complete len:126 (+),score=8.35 GGOE01006571.1:439-816(+)
MLDAVEGSFSSTQRVTNPPQLFNAASDPTSSGRFCSLTCTGAWVSAARGADAGPLLPSPGGLIAIAAPGDSSSSQSSPSFFSPNGCREEKKNSGLCSMCSSMAPTRPEGRLFFRRLMLQKQQKLR